MGHVNVIWQGDAVAVALRCLAQTTMPTSRSTSRAQRLWRCAGLPRSWRGDWVGRRVSRQRSPTGWINNASRMVAEFGEPRVPIGAMLDWTADWISRGMTSLGKPTHYEVRDGRF